MLKQLNNQRGSVVNLILIVVVILSLLGAFYDPKAPPEELSRLARMSKDSPEAQKIYKNFITQNPAPTKNDLREIKAFIESEAAIKISREITGNPDLKSDIVLKKEDDERSAKEREELALRLEATGLAEMPIEDKILWVLLNLPKIAPYALLLLIPVFGLAVYSRASRPYEKEEQKHLHGAIRGADQLPKGRRILGAV